MAERTGERGATAARERAHLRPSSDVIETADGWLLRLDLPGVPREAVAIELEDDRLVVRADTPRAGDEPPSTDFLVERRTGPWERAFRLPADVEHASIQATMDRGVLELELPRRRPPTRRIEIRPATG